MTKNIFLFLAIVVTVLPGCKKDKISAKLNSFYYDTTDASWSSSDNGITWTASFQVTEITADVLDNGAVLVYEVYDVNGVTYNEQVPTYYPASSFNISSVVSVGYIDVYFESTNTVP